MPAFFRALLFFLSPIRPLYSSELLYFICILCSRLRPDLAQNLINKTLLEAQDVSPVVTSLRLSGSKIIKWSFNVAKYFFNVLMNGQS